MDKNKFIIAPGRNYTILNPTWIKANYPYTYSLIQKQVHINEEKLWEIIQETLGKENWQSYPQATSIVQNLIKKQFKWLGEK